MAPGLIVTRPSPLDVALESLAPELDRLREALGADGHRYDHFARNPDVQRLLERLESPELVTQHPEAAQAYLTVLFAAYRFRDAGSRVVAPERTSLERALEGEAPRAPPVIPGGACYLQLPYHWIWARANETGPHEPLDGIFLSVDDRGQEITVVAVLGLHAARAGFTQIALHVPPADFLAAAGAARRPPFAPLMDGGAARGFRSVATAGELLLLVSLALALPAQ